MKIERVSAPPPPREIALVFSTHEGWAVAAALREYAESHPNAHDAKAWERWALDLDKELRRA